MKRNKILFPILSILFGTLLTLIILEGVFRILPVRDSFEALPVNSSNPLIRYTKNRDVTWSLGPDFSTISKKHINNYGFLNDQDYVTESNSPLLSVIGDSYVQADQVKNKDSMHGVLSSIIKDNGRVYSFGVSGAPLSTYLAYAKYATEKFNSDRLVFIIIGNDFDTSSTKYQDVAGFHYFSHNTENWDLVRKDYEPNLLRTITRKSAFVRYLILNLQLDYEKIERVFNKDETGTRTYISNTAAEYNVERITDSNRVISRFFEELPKMTGLESNKILFILDGIRPQLYDSEALKKVDNSYYAVMSKYFTKEALDKGYEVIDLQPAFIKEYAATGKKFEYPTDGHWNEAGHLLAAKEIEKSKLFQAFLKKSLSKVAVESNTDNAK